VCEGVLAESSHEHSETNATSNLVNERLET